MVAIAHRALGWIGERLRHPCKGAARIRRQAVTCPKSACRRAHAGRGPVAGSRIGGGRIDKVVVGRAVKLSAEKYCSATIMLSKSVEITHDFEIIKEPSVVT